MTENVRKYSFYGGNFSIVPAGVVPADKSDDGQEHPYAAGVKIVGIGKYPVKLPLECVKALLETFANDPQAREFLNSA